VALGSLLEVEERNGNRRLPALLHAIVLGIDEGLPSILLGSSRLGYRILRRLERVSR
jgi:hypothetical protein